jgi:hypothetical protein
MEKKINSKSDGLKTGFSFCPYLLRILFIYGSRRGINSFLLFAAFQFSIFVKHAQIGFTAVSQTGAGVTFFLA